jgi:hypothetical protein
MADVTHRGAPGAVSIARLSGRAAANYSHSAIYQKCTEYSCSHYRSSTVPDKQFTDPEATGRESPGGAPPCLGRILDESVAVAPQGFSSPYLCEHACAHTHTHTHACTHKHDLNKNIGSYYTYYSTASSFYSLSIW